MCFKSLFIACAIIALAPAAQAKGGSSDESAMKMKITPDNLATMLYQGSDTEVKWSKMAMEMSQNQEVKQYAQMVAQDHEQMMNQLQQASKQSKISLSSAPSGPMGKNMQDLDKQLTNTMKAMPPHQFDNTFLSAMVMSHDQTLTAIQHAQQMMQGQAKTGGDQANQAKWTALQPPVTQAVPGLEKHRQRAYQLLGQLAPNVAQGGGTMGMNGGMGTQQPSGSGNTPTSNPENP